MLRPHAALHRGNGGADHSCRQPNSTPALMAQACGTSLTFNVLDFERRAPMTKREMIDTGTDKRYVRRDKQGRFDESDDVGQSLGQDQKRDAKTVSERGNGDR